MARDRSGPPPEVDTRGLTSPTLALPYPVGTDPANVPADLLALVTRLEALYAVASGYASLDSGGHVPTAQLPTGAFGPIARKTTAKTVNTTTTETDLLNSEFNLTAGQLGTTGKLRILAWGDCLNNTGAAVNMPRFRFKLGGTVFIDTGNAGAGGAPFAASATRWGWRAIIDLLELGATNAQVVGFDLETSLFQNQAVGVQGNPFTTGEGAWSSAPGPSGTNKAGVFSAQGVATGTVDTTAALSVQMTVINPSALATFETKLYGAVFELV